MLRAAFCSKFKSAETLLIWGDNSDMGELLGNLVALRRDERPSFVIAGGTWLTKVECRAVLGDQVSKLKGSPESVVWAISWDVLTETEELVKALLNSSAAHQYVDVQSDFIDVVMIAVNEYPATLRRD